MDAFGSEVYEQAVQEAGHKDKNLKMATLLTYAKTISIYIIIC